jgi:hypothetical protein
VQARLSKDTSNDVSTPVTGSGDIRRGSYSLAPQTGVRR